MPLRNLLLLVIVSVLAVSGCAGRQLRPGPSYPASLERRGALDVQVEVIDGRITLTNTTASMLPAGRLWLNAWYSVEVDPVAVGETLRVPVAAFRDEHGERMRGGGFFATEAPEAILLAEWQVEDGLYGLVVVKP